MKIKIIKYKHIIDFPELEIKPITILVGKNGVGKSTFLQPLKSIGSAKLLWKLFSKVKNFEFTIAKNDDIEFQFSRSENKPNLIYIKTLWIKDDEKKHLYTLVLYKFSQDKIVKNNSFHTFLRSCLNIKNDERHTFEEEESYLVNEENLKHFFQSDSVSAMNIKSYFENWETAYSVTLSKIISEWDNNGLLFPEKISLITPFFNVKKYDPLEVNSVKSKKKIFKNISSVFQSLNIRVNGNDDDEILLARKLKKYFISFGIIDVLNEIVSTKAASSNNKKLMSPINALVKLSRGQFNLLNVISILYSTNNSNILLEEPEANLHPTFQSKLAEVLLDERSTNNLIIETHSEVFIRKFQHLVAEGKLNSKDIVLYYFNDFFTTPHEDRSFGPITKIDFDPIGRLSMDFPPGFSDELPAILTKLWNSWRS